MFDADVDERTGQVVFENTTTRVEIIKWYTIAGAPALENVVHGKPRKLVPMSVRFVFEDGDCKSMFLNGKLVGRDNNTTEKVEEIKSVHLYNQGPWPEWLHEVYKLAHADLAADMRAGVLV